MSDIINTDEEKELAPIEIDLGVARRGELDESFLTMFGSGLKMIMQRMFGGVDIPVKVRGSRSEIRSFAQALNKEKKYIKTLSNYGLNDPRTYKDKYKLRRSVKSFERKTGIKWPFKGQCFILL